MRTRTIGLLVPAALAAPAIADNPHRDVLLQIADGALRTSAVTIGDNDPDNPGLPIDEDVCVFPVEFGELSLPNYTDDPGFNAFSDTLPDNTLVGFDLLDALRVWDPDTGDFETIPDETVFINLGGANVTTPASPDEFVPGFFFATTGGSGGIHQHVNFTLLGDADPGIYLLTLRVRLDDPDIEPSPPIYVVFNKQTDDAIHDAATAYVEASCAPACEGDATGDGLVDLADLNLVLGAFQTSVEPGTGADLTGDGLVDLADLNIVLGRFGLDC